jgi:hypothetical protein
MSTGTMVRVRGESSKAGKQESRKAGKRRSASSSQYVQSVLAIMEKSLATSDSERGLGTPVWFGAGDPCYMLFGTTPPM